MDKIEYGVFWKTDDSDKWTAYFSWTSSYDDANCHYKQALENPRCKAAKIVERDISYFLFRCEVKEKTDDKS